MVNLTMEVAPIAELVAQAGAKAHLDRERALGRIEQLLDGQGALARGGDWWRDRGSCKAPGRLALRPYRHRRRRRPRCRRADCHSPGGALTPAGAPASAPDPQLLAELQDGVRGLVASEEWEQRLGGLRLARVLLPRDVRAHMLPALPAAAVLWRYMHALRRCLRCLPLGTGATARPARPDRRQLPCWPP